MKLLQTIKNLSELVVFTHTIFSLPFILIAMIVAADGWFGYELLFFSILAAATARNFAMGFNRLVDTRFDALNPRTQNRPSVDGRLSKKTVLLFTLANAAGFVIVSYFINNTAFLLSFAFLPILAGYSYVKRFSSLAHLVLGLCLGLAPLAGAIAVLGYAPLWSFWLSAGVLFWVAGFDILYSLQDAQFDKEQGLFSIPSRLGEEKAMDLAALFHLLTILCWTAFVNGVDGGLFLHIALAASTLLLLVEHLLVRKDRGMINRAFFTVNGYLGMLFLAMTVLDHFKEGA